MPQLLRYFRHQGLSRSQVKSLEDKILKLLPGCDVSIDTELCYNIQIEKEITHEEEAKLKWLLSEIFQEDQLSIKSYLENQDQSFIIEVGPRLNVETAYSTNAISICHGAGINAVQRIEVSTRYVFSDKTEQGLNLNLAKEKISKLLYDKMTETIYNERITTFKIDMKKEEVFEINILENGISELEKFNVNFGLALDEWDLDYYYDMFFNNLKRNPTNVECFDLAQSNSEHSRHWFFKGRMVIDGKEKEKCLMKLVSDTQNYTNENNVIKFSDNSSAIRGFAVKTLLPSDASSSSLYVKENKLRHLLFTAETHNFPTGVAPFPGAATGTGGRIRDTHSTGQGSYVIAGTAGYCFGNLNIPGYNLPWEEELTYPGNFAVPLKVIVEASNGASDYGNKFGEPVVCGFSRSFGLHLPNGERREWIKPIMFSGGFGSLENEHIYKREPEKGMKVVKIGGPIYRIGVGGGAASSIQIQGDNKEDLDFSAVQRGDPEMEQKLNRLIRACCEMGEQNPICSIHDQGAGGNGNVLKEISEPAGAIIHVSKFLLGDPTLSTLEIWGAEYQESDAILVEEKDAEVLKKISKREKVPICFVGEITGEGSIVLEDSHGKIKKAVDLPLDVVLGKIPPKTFHLESVVPVLSPLEIPQKQTIRDMLERVLRLPSVASKRFLTNKVDRSVTGLIAQQQCVGPFHTPLADVAVIGLSHFDTVGGATAIGEQPIKCLVDPSKGARLSVAEAFTNLVFAKISEVKDIKCSANWMWPAKLHGEGSKLYQACEAMTTMFNEIGAAIDGGKDSLSMAARVDSDIVKAPGSLVISLYAPCPDITKTVTPDLKMSGTTLFFVKMNNHSSWRTGGSALAQVYNQIGDDVPDLTNTEMFCNTFNITQKLLDQELILAGHDVSDGGLITTVLEMSFASNFGAIVNLEGLFNEQSNGLSFNVDIFANILFAEEPGLVLEVENTNTDRIKKEFIDSDIMCVQIGETILENNFLVYFKDEIILDEKIRNLHSIWEDTSFNLEKLQCNPACVEEEKLNLLERKVLKFELSFTPSEIENVDKIQNKPKVAVLREEGSNGDREMCSALYMVGFDVYDVTMYDLCNSLVSLDMFQGLVFVGGFSYSDVFSSAKGWASLCKLNGTVRKELEKFKNRDDTFSLGVCNGCQLMALLGWVGEYTKTENSSDPSANVGVKFTHNVSERFESRFVNVKILESPSVMLKGMSGSTLGIWVAHGEGRPVYRSDDFRESILKTSLSPIRYVDYAGEITEKYPLNPNGASNGIAGLCSEDGRHLAMMPHPERCIKMWQWAWKPREWKNLKSSPWLKMFRNAYEWCIEN